MRALERRAGAQLAGTSALALHALHGQGPLKPVRRHCAAGVQARHIQVSAIQHARERASRKGLGKRERPGCGKRPGNVAGDRGRHALGQLHRQQPLGAARIVKQLRGAQQRAFRKLRPLERHKPRLRGKDVLVKRRIDHAGHGVQMGKRPIAQLAYGRHACGSGFPHRAGKLHELRRRRRQGRDAPQGSPPRSRPAARSAPPPQDAAERQADGNPSLHITCAHSGGTPHRAAGGFAKQARCSARERMPSNA